MLLEIVFAFGLLLGIYLGSTSSRKELRTLRAQVQQLAATHPNTRHAPVTVVSAQKNLTPQPVKQSTPIDNAIILLYFGAFLFLGAVGLFLAVGGLEGTLKVGVIGLLVVLFYLAGQLLTASKRLKPAGITFIGVGLVLLPFFGLALHTLVFNSQSGLQVWMATSLLALGLYIHAFTTTKQPYVAYFMLASVLSLFESGIGLVALPVYYMCWVMAIIAMGFTVWLRLKKPGDVLSQSLYFSSQGLVPIAIAASLLFIGLHGLMQLAITLVLAAVYYGQLVSIDAKQEAKTRDLLVSACLASGAILVAVGAKTDDITAVGIAGIVTSLISFFLLWMYEHELQKLSSEGFKGLGIIVAVTSWIGIMFLYSQPALLLLGIFAAVVVHCFLALLYNKHDYFDASLIGILTLPLVAGFYWASPHWSINAFVGVYGLLAFLLYTCRYVLSKFMPVSLKLAFYGALAIVAVFAVCSEASIAAIIFAVLALVVIVLSYFEQQNEQQPLFALSFFWLT